MFCHEIKTVHGIAMRCNLPWRHAGEHRFTEVVPITLHFEHFILNNTKGSAIENDQVTNVTSELNDQCESDDPQRYSESQVKQALWKFLEHEIDRLQEDLEERFMQHVNQHRRDADKLLGDPEINLAEEARLEAGDRKYDELTGN